jgi:predicted nucleic acid-binding protein
VTPRILVDTNIVLDVVLDRKPFVAESRLIWDASDIGDVDFSVAAFTIPTIHYICARNDGIAAANRAVDLCLEAFEVAALYRECVMAARRMPGGDFEDNLQIATAITDFMQGIVTRDKRHFSASPIPVYTPTELLVKFRR